MDKDLFIVEVDIFIEILGVLVVVLGDKILVDGFIIVDQGQLVGFGVGLVLMCELVVMQEEKNCQVM